MRIQAPQAKVRSVMPNAVLLVPLTGCILPPRRAREDGWKTSLPLRPPRVNNSHQARPLRLGRGGRRTGATAVDAARGARDREAFETERPRGKDLQSDAAVTTGDFPVEPSKGLQSTALTRSALLPPWGLPRGSEAASRGGHLSEFGEGTSEPDLGIDHGGANNACLAPES